MSLLGGKSWLVQKQLVCLYYHSSQIRYSPHFFSTKDVQYEHRPFRYTCNLYAESPLSLTESVAFSCGLIAGDSLTALLAES